MLLLEEVSISFSIDSTAGDGSIAAAVELDILVLVFDVLLSFLNGCIWLETGF